MSYGPAGYEDDWDDDEFDFGDYSSDNFYKTSVHSKHMDEAPSKSSVTSQFASNKPKVHGTLGSQTSSTTTSKVPFGRGRGRGRGRGGFSTPQNRTNSSYSTEKNGKKQNGQGNLMLTSTGDKTRKNNMVELKNYETAESLRAAILKGDVAVVENILHRGMSADYVLKTGWTGLMHAANCGQLGVLMALTNQGANVNFHKDKFTVLMAACSSDCNAEDDLVLCVNHLIEKGAKINCHDRYLMTPLMYACRNGLVKVVEVLLHHKPDVNKQDQRGWTALSWAASRGHGKIVRILLDENANPKQYTNDGQSAEDLAYDGGFTIIADVLHAAANPTRELRQNVSITKRDSLPNTEKGECTKYGDLELFLFGLELGHLVPLFQAQQVTFHSFLQLTDADLLQIGVSQIGVRKKILSATHDVHTKEWDLSSLPSQQSANQFRSEDLNLVLANVEKHLVYIRCSVAYARKSLLGMADPTVVIQDEEHARQFLDQTKNVLKAADGITEEIADLDSTVKKITLTVPSAPADLIHRSNTPEANAKRKSSFTAALLVGGCVALGLTAVWLSRENCI